MLARRYHLTNLLLHGFTAASLTLLPWASSASTAVSLFGNHLSISARRSTSFLTGLLFALHPLHSVASAPFLLQGRSAMLCTLTLVRACSLPRHQSPGHFRPPECVQVLSVVCYLASLSGTASVSVKGTAYDRHAVVWTAAALACAVTSALSSEEGEFALWALVALDISRLSSQRTSFQSPGQSSEEGGALNAPTAATRQVRSIARARKPTSLPLHCPLVPLQPSVGGVITPTHLQPPPVAQLQHLRSCLLCHPCRKNASKWREHGSDTLAMSSSHTHLTHFTHTPHTSHAPAQAFCFSPRVPPWQQHWRFV